MANQIGKTNKSYTKRLKFTKKGKILARAKGHGAFNSKESGNKQLGKNRMVSFLMSSKDLSRYVPSIAGKFSKSGTKKKS